MFTADQRIFSLILALVASAKGLTKNELLSTVNGYSEQYVENGGNESLERKFERDKDELRLLGIPIQVIDDPAAPGDNRKLRYRIPKEQLQFPADVKFDDDELLLLQVAALSWRDTSLNEDSRKALLKLLAISPEIDSSQLGVAPRAGLYEPASTPLYEAIAAKRVVKFSYRKQGESQEETRRVAPVALHFADNRWYLVAFDLDRDAWRTFLLRRIRSTVKVTGDTIAEYSAEEVSSVLDGLRDLQSEQHALVLLKRGSTAQARLSLNARREERDTALSSFAGFSLYRLNTLDYEALAEELATYHGEAIPVEPAVLVVKFKNVLREISSMHGSKGNSGGSKE